MKEGREGGERKGREGPPGDLVSSARLYLLRKAVDPPGGITHYVHHLQHRHHLLLDPAEDPTTRQGPDTASRPGHLRCGGFYVVRAIISYSEVVFC